MIDVVCILSALCFMTSNILGIVVRVKQGRRTDSFDYAAWKELDPDFLMEEWDHRKNQNGMILAAGVLNAFAWLFFTIPVLQIAWLLSRGGKRQVGVHAAMACLVLAGSYTELITRLLLIGSYNASEWLAYAFNMDNWLGGDENDFLGWRALEVAFLITNGMIIWVDAFEWLALFGILTLIYYSVGTQLPSKRSFGIWWSRFGLFMAFLCFITFAADVLRFEEWSTFSKFAIFVSLALMVFFLPIWLTVLAFQLPKARPKYSEHAEDSTFVQ